MSADLQAQWASRKPSLEKSKEEKDDGQVPSSYALITVYFTGLLLGFPL
jgi:hypothetical protein